MKIISILFFSLILTSMGQAKTWSVDEIIKKANPEDAFDLDKVLDDIELVPFKDPLSGNTVSKVTKVNGDSLFQKAGVKVGDLVVSSSAAPPQKTALKAPQKVLVPQKGH